MVNYQKKPDTNFEELNKKSIFRSSNKKPKQVAERLPQMHSNGVENYGAKQYDNAYIYFKKYLNVIEWLKKCKEYRIEPAAFNNFMPDYKIKEAKSLLQKATDELIKDFHVNLYENTINKKIAPIADNQAKNKHSDDEFLNMALNLPETPTDEPLNKPIQSSSFIQCTQLFQLLKDSRTLIIDTRTADDFVHSRIITPMCINLPASEIQKGFIAKKFEDFFRWKNAEAYTLYQKRSTDNFDQIILMDWTTNHNSLDDSNKLSVLKDILDKWDPGISSKPKHLILDGGFKEFITVYPTYVTNSNVNFPVFKPEDDSMNEILEDVCYPEWISGEDKLALKSGEDETMKNGIENVQKLSQGLETVDLRFETSKNTPQNIPQIDKPPIDRSNKPTEKSQTSLRIELLKKYIETVEDQEKFEKQLLQFDSSDDHDLRMVEDYGTLESKKSAVEASLKKTLEDKASVKKEIELTSTSQGVSNAMINQLESKRFNIENRIQTIKTQREALRKKKLDDIARRNGANTPKSNNNSTYNEPLKSEGSSMNFDLKRSLSSPNLVKISDTKKPLVDRTSKPPDLWRKQGENNNHHSTSWRDPLKRMDPIYRNVYPGITGLKNLGNSCYMNSIIQCLSNTPFLSKYFIDNAYKDDLNINRNSKTDGRVAEEFAHVIKALWRGEYRSIAPRDFKDTIGRFKYQFDTTDQQDSHEFLTFFLEWMHNDLRRKDNKIQIDNLRSPEKEWWEAMEGQTSIISKLFIGQLKSTISCNFCGSRSITYETFNSLSISLPGSSRCTLNECIQHFLSRQAISGWVCPNCKKPQEAEKKFDFVKLAPILIIHLNRFADTDGALAKKDTPVSFPVTKFNFESLISDDSIINESLSGPQYCNYNLYALSSHTGNMISGHYTAYCKNSALNKWYKYDDQTVSEVNESALKALNSSAYLLFYSSLHCDSFPYI